MSDQHYVTLGKIAGVFGIKGWLKIISYTSPKENILNYRHWLVTKDADKKIVELIAYKKHGTSLLVSFAGVEDRDAAASLNNSMVQVERSQLPPAAPGEYYWTDLIGLKVTTDSGVDLGKVSSLLETGANDVLVVQGERERLIPFLSGQSILSIDLQQKLIRVDWDPDF